MLTIGQALGGFGDPAVIFIASLFVVSSGPRSDRRHRLGGTAADPRRGRGKPDAASPADDDAGVAAYRADQRQRRGRRPAAGGGRHRGPAQAQLLAAADAAGLCRACRLDARVDRHAGERPGLGSWRRCRRRRFRLLRIRARRRAAARRARWRSSCFSGSGFCPSATARPCPPISAVTPRRWSSSTVWPAASTRCACAQARPIVGAAPSVDRPGDRFPACNSSPSRKARRRGRCAGQHVAEGDHLLLRGDAEAAAAFAAEMHLAFREEAASGKGEETLFNRRSGLAEVVIPPRSGLIGQERVPGHGHRKRRPDHPRRAARRRRRSRPARKAIPAASFCRPATPCSCRAPGRRSTFISTIPTCWSSARPSWCGARPCRWGRARARRSPFCSPWFCCWRPGSCRRPLPACWPPARSSCPAS